MYDKYLEKCCLCDSNRTKISRKDKLAKRNGLEFSFTQVYIHCHDCGYDFVNKELSSINFENRESSRKKAARLQARQEREQEQITAPSYVSAPILGAKLISPKASEDLSQSSKYSLKQNLMFTRGISKTYAPTHQIQESAQRIASSMFNNSSIYMQKGYI